jgi:hypothetical protein
MIKKNLERCSGAAGYIYSKEIFSFFNNPNSRPSNFLFNHEMNHLRGYTQRVRFFFKKRTLLERLLQDRTTSRLHDERTRNKLDSSSIARETRRSSSSTMKCSRACRCRTLRVP